MAYEKFFFSLFSTGSTTSSIDLRQSTKRQPRAHQESCDRTLFIIHQPPLSCTRRLVKINNHNHHPAPQNEVAILPLALAHLLYRRQAGIIIHTRTIFLHTKVKEVVGMRSFRSQLPPTQDAPKMAPRSIQDPKSLESPAIAKRQLVRNPRQVGSWSRVAWATKAKRWK